MGTTTSSTSFSDRATVARGVIDGIAVVVFADGGERGRHISRPDSGDSGVVTAIAINSSPPRSR